ncbi:hypothetical protein TNCV_2894421 [Trichonephila clavipes]|nr:hypothetical protein TNCV_2894421 [Trichonephila clavipes]
MATPGSSFSPTSLGHDRHHPLGHKTPRHHPRANALQWEHGILVLKPSPCLHNGNEVDDWMGLDEWNSWFKSQVRDSNRSQGGRGSRVV